MIEHRASATIMLFSCLKVSRHIHDSRVVVGLVTPGSGLRGRFRCCEIFIGTVVHCEQQSYNATMISIPKILTNKTRLSGYVNVDNLLFIAIPIGATVQNPTIASISNPFFVSFADLPDHRYCRHLYSNQVRANREN